METYQLLLESAQAGHGRQLSYNQIVEILTIMQAMDSKIGELIGLAQSEIVDAEVIDGEIEIPFEEGPDSPDSRMDSSNEEEE